MIVFPSLSPLTTTENGPPPDVRDTQKEARKHASWRLSRPEREAVSVPSSFLPISIFLSPSLSFPPPFSSSPVVCPLSPQRRRNSRKHLSLPFQLLILFYPPYPCPSLSPLKAEKAFFFRPLVLNNPISTPPLLSCSSKRQKFVSELTCFFWPDRTTERSLAKVSNFRVFSPLLSPRANIPN